jgi:hypothetical protein
VPPWRGGVGTLWWEAGRGGWGSWPLKFEILGICRHCGRAGDDRGSRGVASVQRVWNCGWLAGGPVCLVVVFILKIIWW